MKKMLKKAILTLAMCSFASLSYAAISVQDVNFEDQWGTTHTVSAETQWLIFSSHRDGVQWVKDSLIELELTDLQRHNMLYVADISVMPDFIIKLFAIPKMQDLPFKVYLDKEGETTAGWPRNQEQVSVYKVVDHEFVETQYFAGKEALKTFFQGVIAE